MVIIASWMVGITWAQSTVEVTPLVVKPGETIIISGKSIPGVTFTIEISNSRGYIESFNVTVDSNGEYRLEYLVTVDSPVDIYKIRMDSNKEISFRVSKMTHQQLSNILRMLAVKAKKQAESSLIQARKQGYPIQPEVWDKYTEGVDSIDEATNSIQNQKYSDAQESLQVALYRFREIVDYSYSRDIIPPKDPEQDHHRVQEIINQLRHQYREINIATQKLSHYGFNIWTLEQDLNTMRNRIGEAQALIDEGKIEAAHNLAIRTQQLVQQSLNSLRQRQAEITKQLAEGYQLSLESRINEYIDTFEKLQTIRLVKSTLALEELESLKARLDVSQQLLESGNVDNAMREMHRTEYRLRKLSMALNGEFSSRLLLRIDELTANLQESADDDAVEIIEEIENTKNSLKEYLRAQSDTTLSNSSLTP